MEAGFIPAGSGATGAPLGATAVGSMMAPPASKVIRAPGLKRGKMEEAISDRIKLETVLGLTVNSNAALDCDPNTEMVVYPAGCTIILYDGRKNRQRHIVNAARKCVACVALSSCGRYLAAGESGHAPSVRVWGLREPGAAPVQLVELQGHAHAVTCLAFSMSGKYLVSIGSQHDMIVNVWEWRAGLKLASNKVSSRVKAVSFAESGNYFVTVGFRHVKFWYLEYSRSAKYKEPVPLMGRSAILGEQKDNDFCDVACGRGSAADSTYAITRSGLLCEFNNRRLLDKWVELRTTSANCMSVGTHYIFVGCAEGIVRCFSPSTLQFITTLPRTHYLGVDVSQGTNISHMFSQPSNATYPDAVALTYDEINHKLTVVYNDHSLYVWDVRDIKRVGKSHSALYHSACIWGVDLAPPTAPLPAGSFLTCSSDDTVRVWQLGNTHHHTAAARGPENQHYRANIYSNDLLKVLYVDPELTYLKDVDLSATTEKDKAKSYDDKTGVRCIKISPDGAHVASGDRAGNIRVHSAADASALLTLEAHDAEVLCLEYSGGNGGRPRLLASASRDRLIHVFNVDEDYAFMQTLDDHSSSITAVRFISSGNALQMVSCGADKAILFRQLVNSPSGGYQFAREHNHTGRSTLYDMEVDAGGRHVLTACQDRNIRVYSSAAGRHTKTFRGSVADDGTLIKVALDNSGIYLATSCTDKILSVYDYYSGECMATMYGHSEIVTGLRFTADCQHLISASGDGCIFVWRVPHDMVVTMRARLAQQAIRQGRKVPSSNGACVDSESDSQLGSPPRDAPPHHDALHGVTAPDVPDYTLRIGRLPSWAKKSLGDVADASASPLAPEPPARGKWARRVTADAHIERRLDSDGSKDSSIDSGTDTRMYTEKRTQISSKQKGERPKSLNLQQLNSISALFAAARSSRLSLTLSPIAAPAGGGTNKVTIVSGKSQSNVAVDFSRSARHFTDDSSLGSFKYEDHESTEHDGDVEDISDGERTSSDHRTTYYPPNNDDNAPGEFTVNAMDVEELRASQRRHKKVRPVPESRLALPIVSVSASISGSGQDSEEDDDEVSTPSGDNADRNPLSGSCESIDTLGRREKFLKSAYESLSGAEIDSGVHGTNTSLSAQHHHQQHTAIAPVAAPRNAALISAARATRADVAKREELNRRIAETRRQLESVGFRSNLKSSQSSTDLSYIPEKESPASRGVGGRPRPISLAVPNSTRHYAAGRGSETEESGGMRRAISLSDLAAKPSPAPRTPVQASGKASSGTNPSGNSSKSSGFVRPASRHNTKTNMTRSSSVGVLNQSDSESDASAAPSSRGGSGMRGGAGLMRPTISSLNKAAANVARRRGLQSAYSSVNLSTVGAEDSSSEAEGGGKPAVPPRPLGQQAPRRAIGARSGSERDLSAKAREVTARLTGGAGGGTRASRANAAPPQDAAATLQGVPDGQLSSALCSQLTEQLTRTADKVVALYRKLQHGAPALDHPHVDNAALINGLETAILETQQVLRGAVSRREPLAPDGVPRARPLSAVASTTHKLEELLAKGVPTANGGLPQDSTISLIEEYSDILLSMMQRNMVASFNQTVSPESLPNPQTGGEHDS